MNLMIIALCLLLSSAVTFPAAQGLSLDFRSAFRKKTSMRRFYRDYGDDELLISRPIELTEQILPTGAFGILPVPTTTPTIKDTRPNSGADGDYGTISNDESPTSFYEPLSLVTASRPSKISPCNTIAEMSPPAPRNNSRKLVMEWTKALEVRIGRIAMMAALFMLSVEVSTGMSLPQQFSRMMGNE